MTMTMNGTHVPALLVALILLASIICGLIFVICTIVLCKFCYERQNRNEKIENQKENNRNRRIDCEDKKLCRKLLCQSEISKPSQKVILKALDSDLDSLTESSHSHLVNASVQTDESSFQVKTNHSQDATQRNVRSVIPVMKSVPIYKSNDFKSTTHGKSRVKVQIQNYITPISDTNNLQIAQSVIRRYSDNSPYKDAEAMEAESYSRCRSASQTPQSNQMSSTPSISVLPLSNEDYNQVHCLVTPATQRRGSHHLRPFDTHWGHTKLCHSMELVSSKPNVQTDERKVHSFDNALGRKRVSSAQNCLFQVRSLTTSTSEDAATSSLEEGNQHNFSTIQSDNSQFSETSKFYKISKEMILLPNETRTYTYNNQIPEIKTGNFKQRSYQNIMEYPSKDNYKSRKSYVGEFTAHPEHQHRRVSNKSNTNRERRISKRDSTISSWNQSQLSKDSITINVIDSDSEKNISNIYTNVNHPKLSVSSMIDPNLSPRTAAARRRQFSRERQSLIQASDINELHQMIESSHENRSMKQTLDRDYSIDERSSAIFNEFMREDPKLGKHAMEAQMLDKIRTQRKGTNTPTKVVERSRSRLENKKAASFAGKDDFQSNEKVVKSTKLEFPILSSHQQRRQSIGKMKVQSCDHRIQLPVIILPEDSP